MAKAESWRGCTTCLGREDVRVVSFTTETTAKLSQSVSVALCRKCRAELMALVGGKLISAAEDRVERGHDEQCGFTVCSPSGCTCGHDGLSEALVEVSK